MNLELDEFNLLADPAHGDLYNFISKNDPTLDLMYFMQIDPYAPAGQTANFAFTANLTQANVLQQENMQLKQQLLQAYQQVYNLTQQLALQTDQLSAFQQANYQVANLNAVIDQQAYQLREYDNNLNYLIVENEKTNQENAQLKQQLAAARTPQAGTGVLSTQGHLLNVNTPILNEVIVKLNDFIIQTNIYHNEVDQQNVGEFVDFVLQNCVYLLKKQNKLDQEVRNMQIQNQRIKDVCQYNLALVRMRVEQVFGCRLNITDFESVQVVRADVGRSLEFKEVNGELRLLNSNYLSREDCRNLSLKDVVRGFLC